MTSCKWCGSTSMRPSSTGIWICIGCENHDRETRQMYADRKTRGNLGLMQFRERGLDPEVRLPINYFVHELLSDGVITVDAIVFAVATALNAERRILLRLFEQAPEEKWAEIVLERIGREEAEEVRH